MAVREGEVLRCLDSGLSKGRKRYQIPQASATTSRKTLPAAILRLAPGYDGAFEQPHF